MKRFLLLFLLIPAVAWASVSGMDDRDPNIPPETQKKLDEAITTYYREPTPRKVETVLDIMNNTRLLRKKTAWAPMIGFLTVVFAHNQPHLFDWMSRNDYNTYAQDVFIAALQHAKLKETALVFAQAHQWKPWELKQLREAHDPVDLKHLSVVLPGHVDTLWGAFFSSGDPVYVNEIIDVVLETKQPFSGTDTQEIPPSAFEENKMLAETTLRQYALVHKPVRDALEARAASEPDEAKRSFLARMLPHPPRGTPGEPFHAASLFAAIAALLAGIGIRRYKYKRK